MKDIKNKIIFYSHYGPPRLPICLMKVICPPHGFNYSTLFPILHLPQPQLATTMTTLSSFIRITQIDDDAWPFILYIIYKWICLSYVSVHDFNQSSQSTLLRFFLKSKIIRWMLPCAI